MNVLSLLLAGSIWAAPMTVAPDRMAEIDGERTFMIGLYEYPQEEAVLQQVAAAGFNLVQSPENPEALDRLHEAGLHAWINTGARIDLSEKADERAAELMAMVEAYAAHPAFTTWEIPDEALWNVWYAAMGWRNGQEAKEQRERIAALSDAALAKKLAALRDEADAYRNVADFVNAEKVADQIWVELGTEQPHPEWSLAMASQRDAVLRAGLLSGYRRLKRLDAQHPIWMNHAPRNSIGQLAAYTEAADVVGCDIYPIPLRPFGHSDLVNATMSSVGAYTDRMQAAGPGKPVWMVLQAFGWPDIQPEMPEEKRAASPRPTYEETRFMAYDAIVHGARGILYWGSAYIEKDSVLWSDLMRVVRELADLQPVLSAPDARKAPKVRLAPSWASLDEGVRVLPKKVGRNTWYIVVNESATPLRYTLDGVKAAGYRDAHDGQEVLVEQGALTLGIAPYGVQVLEPLPRASSR